MSGQTSRRGRVSISRRATLSGFAESERRRALQHRKLILETLEQRQLLSINWGNIPWQFQGPAPTINGQIAGVTPNNEVIGAIEAIAAHPTDPSTVYIGAVNGGVWKTTNATAASPTWIPLTDALPSQSIGDMEFDPTDGASQTLLVGTGRYSSFGRVGDDRVGLYYTTNGGTNWTEFNATPLAGKDFRSVAARGSILLAGSTSSSGLYRSADGGASWTQISGSNGLNSGPVYDLVGDPGNSSRLYAAVGGVSGGIFQSDDTGATWINVTGAVSVIDGATNNMLLAVHNSAAGNIVYAGVVNSGHLAAVYASNDLSVNPSLTWTQMATPALQPGGQGDLHFSLAADPTFANLVYIGGDRSPVGSTGNILRGDTATGQFTLIAHETGPSASAPHADSRALVFAADGTLLEGDDGGFYRWTAQHRDTDAGAWSSVIGNLGVTEVHDIAYDSVSNIILVGTQDNADMEQQTSGGAIWRRVASGDGGDVAVANNVTLPGYAAASTTLTFTESASWSDMYVNSAAGFPSGYFYISVDSEQMFVSAVSGSRSSVSTATEVGNTVTITTAASHAFQVGDFVYVSGVSVGGYNGGMFQITAVPSSTTFTYTRTSYADLPAATGGFVTDLRFKVNRGVNGTTPATHSGGASVATLTLAQPLSVRYASSQNLGGLTSYFYSSPNVLMGSVGINTAAITDKQFITPIAVNSVDPSRLMIGGSGHIYESLDLGRTITALTDFGGGPAVGVNGTFSQTPIAYGGYENGVANPDVFYVGSGDTVYKRTASGGAITATAALPGVSFLMDVVMNPADWKNVFAIDNNHVFESTDAGTTWTEITGDLFTASAGKAISALAYVPGSATNAIVVGTRSGAFISTSDSFGTWAELGSGMPDVLVFDLQYDATDDLLVAGTLGRSAWSLSNVSRNLGLSLNDRVQDSSNSPSHPAVTVSVADQTGLNSFLADLAGVAAPANPVTIALNLAGGQYTGASFNVPHNVTLVIDGLGGQVVLNGSSPALVVAGGDVIAQNGVVFNQTTAFPTIEVQAGGTLTLIGCTVNESSTANEAALAVAVGGSLTLDNSTPNTLNVIGAGGRLLDYAAAAPLNAVGTILEQDGAPIGSNFAIEDAITHRVDGAAAGLVTWVAGNIYVTPAAAAAVGNNDFTRLANAIGAAQNGFTVNLSGTFDWNEVQAAAAYDASVAHSATADLRGVVLPDGVNNLTITSPAGDAHIIGRGDYGRTAYDAFLVSNDGPATVGNGGLTIEKLNIDDFESGVMLGWNSTGQFNGTKIRNNTITVAGDDDTAAFDVQNIAVYFTQGANQQMTGNTVHFQADGAHYLEPWSFGFQNSTTGGTGYDGLLIDGNTFDISVAGSGVVFGVRENGHNDDNASHITISNNSFLGVSGGHLFDRALMLTSQTTNLVVDHNTFTDVDDVFYARNASSGISPGDRFAFTNNILTRVGGADGVFLRNVTDDAIHVAIDWNVNNSIDGFTGVRGLNELSLQATGSSRPAGGASDLAIVNGSGAKNPVYADASWGAAGRFTDPDGIGSGNVMAFGFNAYGSIQAAVNAADVGGTVNVAAGTYVENVSVGKALSLVGANQGVAGNGARGAESNIVGGVGVALTIAADNVTVAGFQLTGGEGVKVTGRAGFTIQDNLINAGAMGVDLQGVSTTATSFTVRNNKVLMAAQEIAGTGTVGILLTAISGAQAPTVSGNDIAGAGVGYLLYDVNTTPATTVSGGAITGAMQGVVVMNVSPTTGLFAPSTFVVDGPTMTGFTGTATDSNRNFHAGVYVFTGGVDASKAITGTLQNVTVKDTGNTAPNSAGLSFSDFSGGVGPRQNITVQNVNIADNLNRGLLARGANALVNVTQSTLTNNGFDPYGLGGNDGFGAIAWGGATLSINQSFITNPAVNAAYHVYALAVDLGTLTVSNSSLDNNGNPAGYLVLNTGPSTANASGNWWGTNDGVAVASKIVGAVDYTPWLGAGADVGGNPANGFQGDFSNLWVDDNSPQTGATGRIQEGVNLASAGGTVHVSPGTYAESVDVNKAVTLAGTGTITGSLTLSAPGAVLSPGNSPGIIYSGDLTLIPSSTLNIELAGPAPGTGYDQVDVTGAVSLGSATLALASSYLAAPNQQFVIVNNDGADPVSGQFAGLSEGAWISAGGQWFRISYSGGDGNDVVLAAKAANLYVDLNAVGANSGVSWTDAFTDLQAALAIAQSGDTIHVADGTYKPGMLRSDSFNLIDGVQLLGGYAGFGAPLPDARVFGSSILSGDIGTIGVSSDNSLHVVYGSGLGATTILDGFTVRDGYADGVDPDSRGAGLYLDSASLTIRNALFTNNAASYVGGAIENAFGNPTIVNSSFLANSAHYGGGIHNRSAALNISGSLFYGNSASGDGAALSNLFTSPVVVNCTFTGNLAPLGGGISSFGGSPVVTNTILWGDTGGEIADAAGISTVTYSDVQGGFAGTGNISVDPLFVAPVNFRLQAASPAINVGNNGAVPLTLTTDLDGNPRIRGGNVDMGAYEAANAAPTAPVDSDASANSVAEAAVLNTPVHLTAFSIDSDLPPQTLTYTITADTSGGGFQIDPSSGVVTVADPSKLDYESSAPGHSYSITVQVDDGIGGTASQSFSIGVTDVAPSTPTDSDITVNSVAEGSAHGTLVGVTASSTDPNGAILTYALTADSSGGGFQINPLSGVVTVADGSKIDYESTAPGHSYTITVRASDGLLTASQSFTISVSNVAPTASADQATISVNEGQTASNTGRFFDPGADPVTLSASVGTVTRSTQQFGASTNFAAGANPYGLTRADVNADGKADLLVADFGGSAISVLLGNGDGTFAAPLNSSVGANPIEIAVDDFNGDSQLDLAVTNYGGSSVSVLLGNGDGTFPSALNYPTGLRPYDVAIADLNADGKLDLIVGYEGNAFVSVLLGNGDGTFGAAVNYGAGLGASGVAVGDFNHDGRIDVAASSDGSGTVSVLLGNGDGTLQAAVDYAVGGAPYLAAASDLNGDGRLDLVAANYSSGTLSVLLGNGAGTFAPAVSYAAGGQPYDLAVADFNADAIPDLVVSNWGGSGATLLLGTGGGAFAAPVSVNSGGISTRNLSVGDFNGDHRPDLAVADYAGNSVGVLLNTLNVWNWSFTTTDGPAQSQLVTITVDDGSSTGTATFNLVVNNVAPTATIGNDGPVGEASPATVSMTGSDVSSVDATSLHYFFSTSAAARDAAAYGDGGVANSQPFTFNDNGVYTVYGRVLDKDGGYSDYQTAVTVTNVAPTATISNNGPVDEGSPATVTMVGSDVSSIDAASLRYFFSTSSAARNAASYAGSGAANTQAFTFYDNGTYTVYGRVLDKDGGYSDYQTDVSVDNVAPSAVSATAAPDPINEGSSTSVSGSFADPGTLDTHTVTIVWGDGSPNTVLSLAAGVLTFASGPHTYLDNRWADAPYTINLTVADDDGGSGPGSTTVTVHNVAPTDIGLSNATVLEFQPIGTVVGLFSSTDPGILDTFTYTLVPGPGSTDNAAFSIDASGHLRTAQVFDWELQHDFTIRVRSTDKDLAWVEKSFAITVAPLPYQVLISPESGLFTTEGGGLATFTVRLSSPPTAQVVVGLQSTDLSEGTLRITDVYGNLITSGASSISFTPGNWNIPQTVTVIGVDDVLRDGDVSYRITLQAAASADWHYSLAHRSDALIVNVDDDLTAPGISVTPNLTPGATLLTTTEAGGTASFSVVLNTRPTFPVTIGLLSSDTSEGVVAPASLVFTPANWNLPQVVTVTGVSDAPLNDQPAYTIVTLPAISTDANYSGLNAVDVLAVNGPVVNQAPTITTAATAVLNPGHLAATVAVRANDDGGEAHLTYTWTVLVQPAGAAAASFAPNGSNAAKDATVTFNRAGIYRFLVTVTDAQGLWTSSTVSLNVDQVLTGLLVAPVNVSVTPGSWQTFTAYGLDQFGNIIGTPPAVTWSTSVGIISSHSGLFHAPNAPASGTVTATAGLLSAAAAVTVSNLVAPGISVVPVSGLITTEGGGQASFSIMLNSRPIWPVAIGLQTGDASEGTLVLADNNGGSVTSGASSLVFTPDNWYIPQIVTVAGVDDALLDGNVLYTIVTQAAASNDPSYNGLNPADVSLTNLDNDGAFGITVTPTSGLTTTEAGGPATFTVVLNSQPTANVSIALASSDLSEGTAAPLALTFTPANWNVPQTVTVTGVDDPLVDGNSAYTIITQSALSFDPTYNGLDPADVALTNLDNDVAPVAGISVAPTAGLITTEAGGTASFTVVLGSAPTANVSIGLLSSNPAEGAVWPLALSFTPANWNVPQTVTVTGVDDLLIDGAVGYTIITQAAVSADVNFNGLNAADVAVTNLDNDVLAGTPGITVTPTSGLVTTEGGGVATFTMVLTGQPTANVSIDVRNSDLSEGLCAPPTLVFTPANWNVPQVVTVTGVDDWVIDGNIAYSVVTFPAQSADPRYAYLDAADVALVNMDDDLPGGIVISPTSGLVTTEEGGTATFTVVLITRPESDVTIPLACSDFTEGAFAPAALVFTPANWNTPQTVTLSGVDDTFVDGNIPYTLVTFPAQSTDPTYAGLDPADVTATNLDNDTIAAIGLYDGETSTFLLRYSDSEGAPDAQFAFGAPKAGWKAIAGDWNGDGVDTIGLYDPHTSMFYLRNNNTTGPVDYAFGYGDPAKGDRYVLVMGDWNGDGVTTIGLYDRDSAQWFLRNTNDVGYADVSFGYGMPGSTWSPIVGDWNGDGIDTIGFYDAATAVYYLRNTNDTGYADYTFGYGVPGSKWTPIMGDWDGNQTATIGFYDQASAHWFLRNSNDVGMSNVDFGYGAPGLGWTPIVGKWTAPAHDLPALVANPLVLTDGQLQPLVAAAIAHWTDAGAPAAALARMAQARVLVADLSDATLGQTVGGNIYLDRHAAGDAWFVDSTPALDEEFARLGADTQLTAVDARAADKVDLLTVIEHELGHVAGLRDLDASATSLMSGSIATGIRRNATAREVDAIFGKLS